MMLIDNVFIINNILLVIFLLLLTYISYYVCAYNITIMFTVIVYCYAQKIID